jgi:hypothetical protein
LKIFCVWNKKNWFIMYSQGQQTKRNVPETSPRAIILNILKYNGKIFTKLKFWNFDDKQISGYCQNWNKCLSAQLIYFIRFPSSPNVTKLLTDGMQSYTYRCPNSCNGLNTNDFVSKLFENFPHFLNLVEFISPFISCCIGLSILVIHWTLHHCNLSMTLNTHLNISQNSWRMPSGKVSSFFAFMEWKG